MPQQSTSTSRQLTTVVFSPGPDHKGNMCIAELPTGTWFKCRGAVHIRTPNDRNPPYMTRAVDVDTGIIVFFNDEITADEIYKKIEVQLGKPK